MVWTQCINPFGHVPQLPKALPLQKSFGELSPALKPWASELPRDEICFKNPTFWLRRLGMVLVDRCWKLTLDVFYGFLSFDSWDLSDRHWDASNAGEGWSLWGGKLSTSKSHFGCLKETLASGAWRPKGVQARASGTYEGQGNSGNLGSQTKRD